MGQHGMYPTCCKEVPGQVGSHHTDRSQTSSHALSHFILHVLVSFWGQVLHTFFVGVQIGGPHSSDNHGAIGTSQHEGVKLLAKLFMRAGALVALVTWVILHWDIEPVCWDLALRSSFKGRLLIVLESFPPKLKSEKFE